MSCHNWHSFVPFPICDEPAFVCLPASMLTFKSFRRVALR